MSDRPAGAGVAERGEIPYLRPHPGAALFARRAERFAALAAGHTLPEFLRFCGRLSAAQAFAFASVALPAETPASPGTPPLAATPSGGWVAALRAMAAEIDSAPMPVEACAALDRLAVMGEEELAVLSGAIVAREFAGLDLAEVPFAAAALQVEFAARAAAVPPASVERARVGCPLCGSPPVAGLVLGDDKLRYLECALCGSRWHLTRVKCSHCGSTEGISYLGLEGDPGDVKAEVCERCTRYVKLFYLERRPAAEPAADDIATIALDVLVAESGYARHGVNLFLPA